jgi:sugar-specific transcriptional regulator TrmB
MTAELLRNIGLTESEIKVYLALLDLGSTSKGPLVTKSGVASSKIYELLEKLLQKGLVSYVIKSKVKYFEAAPTKRILDYVQDKARQLKNQEEELKDMLPTLELRRAMSDTSSKTQTFQGLKGAKTAFEDILSELKKGDEYYVLGISKFDPVFKRFVINFHKKRAQQGIKCKILVNELAKEIGEELSSVSHTKIKYLPANLFTPVVFIVYKDKTLISLGLEEVFILIDSKNLSDGLKTYAKHMWQIGVDK